MPKKKKVTTIEGSYPVEVEETATIEDLKEAVQAMCNHQNRHYTAGVLTCILPKNHGGDHFGYVNDKPTAWSDAAGEPVRKYAS